MTASELEAAFNTLGQRFDQYSGGVSKVVGDTLQRTLAQWQDFFYSGEWPANKLAIWEDAYHKASQMLDAAITSGAAQVAAVGTPVKNKTLSAVLITGGDPLSMADFPSAKPWQLALLGLPLLLLWFAHKR